MFIKAMSFYKNTAGYFFDLINNFVIEMFNTPKTFSFSDNNGFVFIDVPNFKSLK